MKKLLVILSVLFATVLTVNLATAAADIEVNTPAISAIQSSMQARHSKLGGFYSSGAVGLTKDGLIAVRDANSVPLAQRQAVNNLVKEENTDRSALYKEIATANGHPEWMEEIRNTFAQRWIQKAQAGWYYQDGSAWVKK